VRATGLHCHTSPSALCFLLALEISLRFILVQNCPPLITQGANDSVVSIRLTCDKATVVTRVTFLVASQSERASVSLTGKGGTVIIAHRVGCLGVQWRPRLKLSEKAEWSACDCCHFYCYSLVLSQVISY
jgi:hypothetical protein